MASENTIIVLDDDDDEDVEFIGSNVRNAEQPKVQKQARHQLPQSVNGYSKPTSNYPKMITLALITCPDRKATEKEICEIIARHYPYFQYCPNIWHTTVQSILKRRKKFFCKVGVNRNFETIWSFNPEYEKLMIMKWIPKYLQQRYLSQEIDVPQTSTPVHTPETASASETLSTPVIVSFESLRPQSPVFVSSGKTEFVNYESLIPETNVEEDEPSYAGPEFALEDPGEMSNTGHPTGPEFALEDPGRMSNTGHQTGPEFGLEDPGRMSNTGHQTGPEFALEDPGGMSNTGHPTNNEPASAISGSSRSESNFYGSTTNQTLCVTDFTLSNLLIRGISNVEIQYRVDFQRDHTKVEKFRLHCTVCDVHLGTSGFNAKFNVRFHCTLGVLVCSTCFLNTNPPTSPNVCKWCGRMNTIKYSCQMCTAVFCEDCLKRNFGAQWYHHVFQNVHSHDTRWKCFICDVKQIWPHRAIAYFLYRHYKELKRKKLLNLPYKNSKFFKVDLSVCCKAKSSTSPLAPAPLPLSALDNSQTFVIGNQSQSPNQIYLNTPPAVSSVTLNTGTQYIHNVYPDKNYVFVQAPVQFGSTGVPPAPAVRTCTIPTTEISNSSISLSESVGTPENDLAVPNLRFPHSAVPARSSSKQNSHDKQYPTPPPHIPIGNAQPWSQPLQSLDTSLVDGNLNSQSSQLLYASSQNIKPTSNVEGVRTVGPYIMTSASQEDTSIIVPDNEQAEEVLNDPNPADTSIPTPRQIIERRPMPKSKKQTLLRTVLMNESIESMKRHLITHPADISSKIPFTTEDEQTRTPSHSSLVSKEHQTGEEPILQSIIESAQRRLIEINKKQNLSISSGTIPDGTLVVPQNQTPTISSDTGTPTVPKIKIRTLKELQGNNIINASEQNNARTLTIAEEMTIDADTIQAEKGESPDEVNVSPLKESIIEACRTLLSTQKKFKELALLISSNLLYKKERAQDLVNQFQNILQSCQNHFDVINKNLKKELCNFIASANMDSIYESIKKTSDKSISKTNLTNKRRRRKVSQIHGKRKKLNTVANPTGGALQQMETNGCEELNPAEGASDGDLYQTDTKLLSENKPLINQHIVNWKIEKAKKKVKRCIWNDRRKKRGRMSIKKDSTPIKRSGRRRKAQICDDVDEADELSDSSSVNQLLSDKSQSLRKRVKKPVPPIRISGRRHPSSEEYISHLMPSDSNITSENYQVRYEIKRCSVLLHRLDPRIVELLKWRAAKVL